MTLLVKVTQGDIEEGRKADCQKCPIALAAGRSMPGSLVEVTCGTVYVRTDGDDPIAARVPRVVRAWIYSFDRGYQVYPISFTLEFN